MRIIICGGGVIGASIAYFLSLRGASVTVVERTALACAASGKSGGFLALDWCDGTPLEALARRSFRLHAELAGTLKGDWGYRRLTTYAGFAPAQGGRRRGGIGAEWLADDVVLSQRLGSAETTAQVHPEQFTRSMIGAAEARGAEIRLGQVTWIVRRSDGSGVTGVTVDGGTIAADAVVIAMGPWSILAAEWLRLPPVYGLKGHSLVFDTGNKIPAEALFLEAEDADGALTPEIVPRPDGTTWICAVSSDAPLPHDPGAVTPDPGAMERLEALSRRLSPVLAQAPILHRQACFRPVTQDGLPLIGPVPGLSGAYVATGHSVWGILNAPATGEAMAELILDGSASSIDLTPFDPGHLRPLDPRQRRRPA